MTDKLLKILEYNKILELIRGRAVTSIAKEKILELRPCVNYDEVVQLQQETSEATAMLARRAMPPIAAISDIRAGLRRSEAGGILGMGELMAVASVLHTASALKRYLETEEDLEIINSMAYRLTVLKELERDITEAIISDEEIADNASGELAAIRRKMRQLNGKIKDILGEMIHSAKYTKYLQEPIVTMRGDRYVLPVKAEYRGNIQGIIHDSSATGATVFVEPMAVVEANNQLRALAGAEKEEIEKILKEFSARVGENSGIINENFNTVIQADVLFAKASFCIDYRCHSPEINRDGYVNIKEGRHPLINSKNVVPINIYLGKDFHTLIITGPNTGGKTVTLKTLGLFSLMTQSGLQIPAKSGTQMPVWEDIFADIGDEQSIEQNLSTFSAHMVNIVDILAKVRKNCLVLFDELGAGTDPEEGAALAIEILEYVHMFGGTAVATTHYSELKLYAISTGDVENASCEFDMETLSPTYRLLIGLPGKSNAFAISKRLGLPDKVIEGASSRLTAESIRFEDVVAELQSKRESVNEALAEAEKIRVELKNELRSSQEKNREINEKTSKLLDDAKVEAARIVQDAKGDMNAILKEANKVAKEAADKDKAREIEEIRKRLKNAGDSYEKKLGERREKLGINQPLKDVKLGETVQIISINEQGGVVTLPNASGDVMVQVGIIKVKANVKDLRRVTDKKPEKSAGSRYRNISGKGIESKTMTATTELDIRGMMVDEGTMLLDKFIDNAIMASIKNISVIHGKGTGALRAGIQNYLKHNKFVKSYRLGAYGEGDSGVTIIELK
ncbi:MAG: endonuclease MutS2 [Bacillota bacterium]|nr:endonuclease MutS2 [Bacillota bacterium]